MRIQKAISMAIDRAKETKCKLCAKEQKQIAAWLTDYTWMMEGHRSKHPRNNSGRTMDQVIQHAMEIARKFDKDGKEDVARYHMQIAGWLIKYNKMLEKEKGGR